MAYLRKDSFYSRAKRVGYRSRAAYKLEELADRYRLFGAGDHVIDLGAWPGGWLQVAARRVGPTGIVVGIDLQPIEPLAGSPTPVLIQGDILDPEVIQRAVTVCRGRVDIVVSDMAPKLTGIRDHDTANANRLGEAAIALAAKTLRPGGSLVLKLFMSEELKALLALLRTRFQNVRTTRPEATRKGSAEIYAVATNSK
ncbi:MAG: RlmE family RNA methyltransferase [Deltaproteobacteria bacterium]|nr:RlmE family RNA methyltransferase [Deltaproteobacteria bacterium]